MSFGFDGPNSEVRTALKRAHDNRILIFAAMANGGAFKPAAWPANSDLVIGIHSCVDQGKMSSHFTPRPVEKTPNYNFMVVGQDIPAHWLEDKGGGYRSVEGTSFATPVAVAMAALILAFANQTKYWTLRKTCERKLSDHGWGAKVESLWLNEGMGRVLEAISIKTSGGYRSISPELLWRNCCEGDANSIREHAWNEIYKALCHM